MERRIISFCLVAVMLLLFVSCGKEKEDNPIRQPVVAVSSVSGNVDAARDFAKSNGAECIEFSSDSDAVVAVVNGKADYVVLDEYSGYLFEKENDKLCFAEKCEYNIEYRACFSFDNSDLCEQFNTAISEIEKDGTIAEIKTTVYNKEEYITSEPTGKKGVLVMVCDPIFDNRVYFDEKHKLTGTDIYIAKEICNYLGYNLVIETKSFDEMFRALDTGEADFIMSCVEKTEQRAEHYLFSDVYATYNYNVYKLK